MRTIEVETSEREELVSIQSRVDRVVEESGVEEGILVLWSLHTTCGLTVNEDADPDVAGDLARKMGRLAPRDEPFYRHAEGNSDSHVKTSLFGPGLTLLVDGGRVVLGRWQGVFLAEWDGPRTRRVAAKVIPG